MIVILVDFFRWLAKLLKALWLFIAGVMAVILIYYLLTGVEQGVDVVIQSGEMLDAGVLTVLGVFLWSFLVWYSSRTLSYIKQNKDDEIFSAAANSISSRVLYEKHGIPTAFYQHIPRLLAYNCFVSIQVAIFQLPTFFGWSAAMIMLAAMAHNVFYIIINAWFQSMPRSRRRKVYGYACSLIIAGYVAFLIYLAMEAGRAIDLTSHPLRHRFWLALIALTMFLLQVSAVFLFILRRRSIDARRSDSGLRPSRLLRVIGFNPVYNAAETPYFRLLNGTAAVAIVVYLCAVFIMPFSALMGPMAFTLLALGVLTGLSNLITLASIRSSFNVMVLLLCIAFVVGQYCDPYPVRLLRTEKEALFAARPDTQRWLSKWFGRRVAMIDTARSAERFPVYIVLSNGGASRAGKWTSSVLTQLQDTSYRENRKTSFKDHILCIAGASGGTVGNCAFYSLLKASEDGVISPGSTRLHADLFFQADFLTYTLGRLLGPDIFRHLIPFNVPVHNRADALEEVIARGSEADVLSHYFDKPVNEVFDTTGALPALFINATQVDNGMPGVISTVRLPSHSPRQDILSLIDSMGIRHGTGNLRLSTAAILSSRFPYVSPAGKVFDRYYVDGGYFDNSGAGAVLEFIQELNQFLNDSTQVEIIPFRERFTFHILHITNSEMISPPAKDIHPLTNDLLSPVLTLAGMQGASTSIGDGILVDAFQHFNSDTTNAMIVYSLYNEMWDPSKHAGDYEEGYPMSWTLSDYQLDRMDRALQRANARNLWKFEFGRQ